MWKLGSLNCRGINYNLKELQLATDFENYKLDFLAVQETHIKEQKILSIESLKGRKYTLYNSGQDINSNQRNFTGVGIITRENFNCTFTAVSDRICYISFITEKNNIKNIIISAYAPTLPSSQKNPDIRQKFYDELDQIISSTNSSMRVFLLGDFNAKTGSGYNFYRENMGVYGKGVLNENGEFLLELANRHNLILTNTLFQHKMTHRTTWRCPERINSNKPIVNNQIDYILVRNTERHNILDARSYGGIFVDTDHKLVVLKIKEENKYVKYANKKLCASKQNLNLELLKETKIENLYKEEISKKLQNDDNICTTNQQKWNKIMEVCQNSSTNI